MGADRVRPHGGGHDERFRVMDHERLERAARTFHYRLAPGNQVQNVHRAARVVRHRSREPMAAGLDELGRVQTGPLLAPTRPSRHRIEPVNQAGTRPLGVAVVLDVVRPVPQIDRARQAVQTHSAPVPQLEGEDVGGRADLQHHDVRAGAVERARRDQKMIVFAGGPTGGVPGGGSGSFEDSDAHGEHCIKPAPCRRVHPSAPFSLPKRSRPELAENKPGKQPER